MHIILFCAIYPILIIIYFVMRIYRKEKNGCLFGARMKAEWCKNEEIKQIQLQYQKELKRNFIILLLIPLISFFIPYFSIVFTIWMLWIFAAIVALMIPYARANKKVIQWKQTEGLQQENHVQYTEMKYAGEVRCVKVKPYLLLTIPVILAAGAALILIPEDFFVNTYLIIIFALMNPLFYVCARWMDRQKVEVISTDSEVNINFARAKKNIWRRCWEIFAVINTLWIMLLFFICVLWEKVVYLWVIWGSIAYGFATLIVLAAAWKSLVRVEESYQQKRDFAELQDDDRNWIWGMLYYNKQDRHVIVSARTGMGTTTNLATPLGMGLEIFAGLALLLVPVCCIWVILLEFVPIQLKVEDNAIIASHLKIDYEIPLEEIVSMEEISELPHWSRTNGTSMENLRKGTFYIRNVGKCQVLLNPNNTMFLKVETSEKTYYLGGKTDNQTKEVERILKQ